MATYRDIQKRPLPVFEKFKVLDTQVVKNLFNKCATLDASLLVIWKPKSVEADGFRVPKSALAKNADEAVYLAERIGYPMRCKIALPIFYTKLISAVSKLGLTRTNCVMPLS